MQIPENPSNNDIRDALIKLQDGINELNEKVEKLDYKFDTYQGGTDGMVMMATIIIIATASVVIFSGLTPAFIAIITALSAGHSS